MAASKLNRMTPSELRKEILAYRRDLNLYGDLLRDANGEVLYYKKQAKTAQWVGAILTVLALVALLVGFVPTAAWGHDMDPAASKEQNEVYKFYREWLQPGFRDNNDRRTASCCDKTDCSPITAMKRNGSQWFIKTQLGGDQWYQVPEEVWEDNTPELLESPDMRSHACIIGGRVACAVRGSGQ